MNQEYEDKDSYSSSVPLISFFDFLSSVFPSSIRRIFSIHNNIDGSPPRGQIKPT